MNQIHGEWRWFFSNNKPLHLEIGCGKGQFIIANALKYPNINFIALEKDSTILTKAIKKAKQIISQGYKIKNLKFINGDANKIEFIFDDNEIDEIYLNFSDPWPKKRQTKRRLTNTFFLKQYYKILRPHKNIILKTDNESFFDYSIQELELNKNLFGIKYKTNKQKKPSCGQNKEDAAVTCTADSLGPDNSKDKSEHAIWIEAETKDQIPHSSPHPLLIPMQPPWTWNQP